MDNESYSWGLKAYLRITGCLSRFKYNTHYPSVFRPSLEVVCCIGLGCSVVTFCQRLWERNKLGTSALQSGWFNEVSTANSYAVGIQKLLT